MASGHNSLQQVCIKTRASYCDYKYLKWVSSPLVISTYVANKRIQANFVVKADVFSCFHSLKKCPCQGLLNHSPVFIVAVVVSVVSFLFSYRRNCKL